MQYRNNAEVPFSAYITNLGKYTEGRTEGEWVDFPTTKEKLQETMKRIGIGDKRADGTVYEEIFITDYDYNLPELVQLNLGEYENINQLNYLAKKIDEIDDNMQSQFQAAADIYGTSIDQLINLTDNLDKFTLYENVKNDEDFGMKLINDDERKVPEWLQDYIDYEAYGRDEAINRGGLYSEYGYIEQTSDIEEYYKGVADIPVEDFVLLPDDKKMAENIPEILVDELKNADINRRVNTLELTDNQGENLTFVLTLHDGSKCELVVNELQIEMLARAIIHAINNAEMRELALRITSLLDFLPLYDVDCQENGNLEYDTYSQPEWKHNLFDHYLAVLYRFKDESGKEQFSGAVVKTREATPGKEIEAITRRMLDFSPRLKKLAGVPCQVYVRTVAANNAQPLTQDQCLRALHHLRVQSTSKTAPQAK